MKKIILFIVVMFSVQLSAQSALDLPATKADFEKLEKLAKGGDAISQYELALCYRHGIPGVVSMSGPTANKWIKKSADNGNPDACVEVYNWDKQKNVAYGERAKKTLMEIGTGDAYLSMAFLYVYGSNDYNMWLKAAMKNGNEEAGKRLLAIYKHVSTSDDFATWVGNIKVVENANVKESIEEDILVADVQEGKSNIANVNYKNDVDIYAPINQQTNANTFALIIGNEHYAKLPDVPYAINDAHIFRIYCEKTLGIPENNIIYVADGTAANMRESMEDLRMDVSRKKGDATVLFYYAGHGLPDNKTGKAYMIPQDVSRLNQKMCYSISDAMDDLSNMNAKEVVCFLDACFSGVTRDNDMLSSNDGTRAIKRNVAMDVPTGNIVVFSSASNDETSWPLKEKGHGLFTYYLLKKLKDSKGNTTLGDLAEYMKENVMEVTYNTKGFSRQTPTVIVSPDISSSWKNIKLR